jgi:LysR family hca operon transcriptional activator
VLPTGHRLAALKAIRPQDLSGETYITPTKVAPALKAVIDSYAANAGITLKPAYEAENLSMAMSLVASTGGVTLLPLYAENLLSPSVITRHCKARCQRSIWSSAAKRRTRRRYSNAFSAEPTN